MKIRDLAIVGAGPAGMNAAIYAKNAMMDVVVIEKSTPGGAVVNTSVVENYLGIESISGADLALRMYYHLQDKKVDYAYGNVLKIIKEDKLFHLITDEKEILAKTVIVASGSQPRQYQAKNMEKFAYHGISWCAVCDGNLYKGKEVVVLGGANSAVEEAVFLASICKKVTIISRSNFKANKEAIAKMNEQENIVQYQNTKVKEFLGKDTLSGVIAYDKEQEFIINCDGVFEFIGFMPNTGFVDCKKDSDYIITDELMQTNIEGLYAAGDCIKKPLRQIATAISDGAIAAISASKYI